ncbi:uncharacterized protein RSE6_07151 [Rhynchosporium secalis]|uniref:Uncharacterized protein n=1 Tax=Rhynchosporium secalis TaxID=38038 RepID=A0A1E1MC53_RHYSE|nr:uncharacterized protein RSE6_07151 [Rhynchosporium secalis]
MSPYISNFKLLRVFEDSGIKELALFIGDGDKILIGAEETYTGGLHEIQIIGHIFDEARCNYQDVPTDRKAKGFDGGGSFPGLSGLDIWWRTVRPEAEVLAIQYDGARSIGFLEDLKKFEEAFDRGYSKIPNLIRDCIVYSFIAAR